VCDVDLCDLDNYHNPKVDQFIDTLIATFSVPKRRSLANQIQSSIVNDVPWVFGFQPGFHLTMRSKCERGDLVYAKYQPVLQLEQELG
jgi:ABC-type transport system substrate-binding protein